MGKQSMWQGVNRQNIQRPQKHQKSKQRDPNVGRGCTWTFFQRLAYAKRNKKRCSASLILRTHKVPSHTCQNGWQQIESADEHEARREPHALPVGMQIGAATNENSVKSPQENKNRTTAQSRNPASGYCSKGNKNTDSEARMLPNFHSSPVYSRQDMEATQVSINRWAGKETVVCVGVGVCV